VAALGPKIPALGVRSEHEPFMQSQIAATVASLVGEDYAAGVTKAAPPLPILKPAASSEGEPTRR
jgi:hypothetical protein